MRISSYLTDFGTLIFLAKASTVTKAALDHFSALIAPISKSEYSVFTLTQDQARKPSIGHTRLATVIIVSFLGYR